MDTSGPFPILVEGEPVANVPSYTELMAENVARAITGPWAKLTPSSPWVDYTAAGAYRNGLWYRKIGDNLQLSGMVRGGTTNSTIASLASLPAELRPPYTQLDMCIAQSAAALVQYDAPTLALKYTSGTASPGYIQFNLILPLH